MTVHDPSDAIAQRATEYSYTYYDSETDSWRDHADTPGVCQRCGQPPVNGDVLRECGGHLLCRSCRTAQMDLRGWPCPTCPPEEKPQWRAEAGYPVR